MSIPQISEATIRHNSNASSYSRGQEYYSRGAVIDLKKRGNTIQAAVEGSEIKPYQVSINIVTMLQNHYIELWKQLFPIVPTG